MAEFLPEKKWNFLLPVGLCYLLKTGVLCILVSQLYLIEASIYLFILYFPLSLKMFLWKRFWSQVRFSGFSNVFPSMSERVFLGILSHIGGKVYKLEIY